ncbi:hypothetical protein DLM77_20395 [Leptospira yasudae]|uniref:Uncharacterized protein n=1 Tax=Leptospira yasudae TaxID=2202201 RepID=A0ABX9LXM7_9LEPT|nr:hypothetical protein DLM77_20395 [Leptospira yasudae]
MGRKRWFWRGEEELRPVFLDAKESPRSYKNRGSGEKSEELIYGSQKERKFFLPERIKRSL